MSDLYNEEFKDVVYAIDNNKLVLLLGNGIDLVISKSVKSWDETLRELAKNFSDSDKDVFEELMKQKRFLLAADFIKSKDKEQFNKNMSEILKDATFKVQNDTLFLMNLISEINPKYIITTNYTDCIKDGLKMVGYEVIPIKRDEDIDKMHHSTYTPLIHIHGGIENFVLSYSDYFENMEKIISFICYLKTFLQLIGFYLLE